MNRCKVPGPTILQRSMKKNLTREKFSLPEKEAIETIRMTNYLMEQKTRSNLMKTRRLQDLKKL